jgi:glycosyltransferase involved in cell wall biosynthesis
MDILVHLSLREGLPRALPQALAAGRPVVAYDCDGAREVCLHERTGLLVQPRDVTGLKASLLRLANDPALRRRMGAEGREFVKNSFRVERMVDQIESLYRRLLAERGSGSAAAKTRRELSI